MEHPITRSLNELIEELRITKAQFVRDLDVSRQTVINILSGKVLPSLSVIYKILEVYPWVNPGWLISNEGNMRRADSKEGEDRLKERLTEIEESKALLEKSIEVQDLAIKLLLEEKQKKEKEG
jgi:DNA-binding XRE family transcriptional regulator